MPFSATLGVHDLCKKCQTIDLEKILSRRYPAQVSEEYILDLGPVQDLAKGCALCRFFATMANPKANTTNCELRRTSTRNFYLRYRTLENFKELGDTILLFVAMESKAKPSSMRSLLLRESREPIETIYFSSVQRPRSVPHLRIRIIYPEKFDKDFVRDSISYCSANHLSVCQPHMIDAPDFFRLIDCKARQVVVAQPGCEYLALSYVWGTTTRTSTGSLGDLDNCPKVIIDSMDVTLNLSFRYLWVDRYCIDQLDDQDKQHQIRQMDLIYANAVATIIAAAGDGPEYGLPGVNGTVRKHQPQIHVRGHLLASTLPHPSRSVNGSKWATRGWTYQEGILSRRRIVFTDDQVIFECNGMHTLESQALPLDGLHTSDKGRFREEVRHGAFKWKTFKRPGRDIMQSLAGFSKRELSHPADALNAMQGIFQMFLKTEPPIYHIEGVPLVPRKSRAFVLKHSFIHGLSWYHETVGERRPEFPSWSWTGWTGLLADRVLLESGFSGLYVISIHLEYENKIIEDFPKESEWQNFLSKMASKRVKFLHIEGQTLNCTLVRTANEFDVTLDMDLYIDRYDYLLKFELEKNTVFYACLKLDLDELQIEGKPLECIRLYYDAEELRFRSLLIATNTDGVSERLGIIENYICGMQDGEWVAPDDQVCLGMLEKKLQLRTIRLG